MTLPIHKRKTCSVRVWLTEDIEARLQALAEKKGIGVSPLVCQLIERRLAKLKTTVRAERKIRRG